MSKSQETFGKKEKEKKRAKQRQDKAEKMEERRQNAKKGKSLDEMMAYLDENGNISSTPPDPGKRKTFKLEDVQIGVPKHVPGEEMDPIRTGTVTFFNSAKGFGFIKETATGQEYFVHVSGLVDQIQENDAITFELKEGKKGLNAVNVRLVN